MFQMNVLLHLNKRQALYALAVVVAWQLLPDRYLGPFHAWNPHALLEFVLIILAIQWLGRVTVKWLGARKGLLLMGLVSGFASSTATIHIMGEVAKEQPLLAKHAAMAAVLSNLATLFQLVLLIFVLAPALLPLILQPILCGLLTMVVYAMTAMRAQTHTGAPHPSGDQGLGSTNWKGIGFLVFTVAGVSWVAAYLQSAFGENGLLAGAAIAGLIDAHAIVPTLASLLNQSRLAVSEGVMPVLMGYTTNALSKSLIAYQSGGWDYAKKVCAGVWLTTSAVWLDFFFNRV